ncbi:hypothetical protein IFR05_009791 [Cadophora sp. M221]|nr:hypothetical protein IFR05_009791 [Cadophora sp. M221]
MDLFNELTLVNRKLIVGIDFGTTFSGVAWAETRRWFKLGFAESHIGCPFQSGHSEQLTTDYLKQLYQHIIYSLKQKLGAVALRNAPMEFCLTVPAIWTEAAKEKTLKACQNAGLKSSKEILLVSEPEAALIYALHGLDPHGLNIGDTFVLCDAGGGTVDLISYTITALHPFLKVKEATRGTGGLHGSTFLNVRFKDFLTSALGHLSRWDDEALAEAMERFDTVIVELVKGQIRDSEMNIKAILLVGGFGQNTYLKERIISAVGGIDVLQPPNAWTVVARGAVMMGLARSNTALAAVGVISRAARKHYGIELHIDYDAPKHLESRRYFSTQKQTFRVDEMKWFIRRGNAVMENKPHTIDFVQEYPVANGNPKSISLDVLCDPESIQAPVTTRKQSRGSLP